MATIIVMINGNTVRNNAIFVENALIIIKRLRLFNTIINTIKTLTT